MPNVYVKYYYITFTTNRNKAIKKINVQIRVNFSVVINVKQ